MYIPAVPTTPMNQAYIEKQREEFLQGNRPPDFEKRAGVTERNWVGIGTADDIVNPVGRRAMGLPIVVS